MPSKLAYYTIIAVTALVVTIAFVLTQPFRPIAETTTPTMTTQTRTTDTIQTTTEQVAKVVTFTLYLSDYGFNASRGGPTLTVHVGDHVRLTLIGNGSGPVVHDFALDENSPSPYNVKSQRLSRGQTQTLEFVANHAGSFKYYCSVAPPFGQSHRERGQEATIVVLER